MQLLLFLVKKFIMYMLENEIFPITGNVVNENAQTVGSMLGSQTMLLLEIILVLILFVLIMIFFRLRVPASVQAVVPSETFEKKNSDKKAHPIKIHN